MEILRCNVSLANLLFFPPWVWSRSVALGFILMVFTGAYLFTEMGFLMHECWQRYNIKWQQNEEKRGTG